jgi:hypothetical protein
MGEKMKFENGGVVYGADYEKVSIKVNCGWTIMTMKQARGMQYLLNPELKIKHKNTIKLKQLVKKVLK